MEFSIEKEIFFKGLSRVQGIVEKRNTIPILSNVLIESNAEGIFITATDLEVGMKAFYPAKILKSGKITISAKKLYEITKELPDKEIFFKAKENSWVELKCGKSIFNIVGLAADEFPYFPEPENDRFITINSNVIKEMIDKTYFSISTDETKYNLNGIFFKSEDLNDNEKTLSLIATDGHRLSMIKKPLINHQIRELEKGVIFPKKGIYELKKITEDGEADIQLGFMDNNAVIKKDSTFIIMRLVDGEFPDYKRVVPQNNDLVITINKDLFYHSLKRISILSNEKSKGIKITIKENLLELSSSNQEFGEAREELDIEYQGPEITIGYNARYIMDVLQNQDSDKIQIYIKDHLSPGLIKSFDDNDYLAVIMPMRL
ncbi:MULTISPECIES: DNA polymerase III subunit beta [Pseudomonadati]|jgi:DNA polymerase-3 subunit beta|uniref:Beta sliding clamp n=1 Tax=Trichloromonas acetexigens TaxID=38815 RepID=A0A550J5I3_9BACT|nr:DNA polymerase III subunit beta [Desulfuromonas acetexigens]TRO78479.1 DNA polymerase III subunit beta [Desulfuromonas acetexigens]